MPILSRRTFIGAGVVLVAAGAGVVVEFVRHPPHEQSAQARRASASASASKAAAARVRAPLLQDALTREHALLARLETTARTTPALRPFTDVLRADHEAHASAIAALMAAVEATPSAATGPTTGPTTPSPNDSVSPGTSTSRTTADLLRWEKVSSVAIAADAAAVTGGADAAVLASIFACEQTHVAWLS